MVPRFWKGGASFKGIAQYLTHDPAHANTTERVSWTHTVNLAQDHVPSAVNEMLWTFRSAELLKAEAGVHAGGSVVVKPVKHLSLNWHPTDQPSKAEMIATAESFLQHMGWQDHQALIVAHHDKPHPHVHLVVNAIHPVTGRKLDDGFERVRASAWSEAYEKAHGKVHCTERLKPVAERAPSPPRPVWQSLDQIRLAHARAEAALAAATPEAREARREAEAGEWLLLRELQKEERLAYFEAGRFAFKSVRNDVYRAVRSEFAPAWAGYFAARKAGTGGADFAAWKADLVARQHEVLAEQRDHACAELKAQRDAVYRELLDRQAQDRAVLRDHHDRRVPALGLLEGLAEQPGASGPGLVGSRLEEAGTDYLRRLRPSGDAHSFLWSSKAGMVAQTRSALRYLDRLEERGRKVAAQPADPMQAVYGPRAKQARSPMANPGEEKGIEVAPDRR